MSVWSRIRRELKALGWAAAFFGSWFGLLVAIKTLLLEDYGIEFVGWSKVVLGALVLSKVVLILEHVPLGAWIRSRPAWVDVVVRTAVYTAGVAAVLVLEHGIAERRAAGGFLAAIRDGFRDASASHLLVNVISVSGALFFYIALRVVNRRLGAGGVLGVFRAPVPAEPPDYRA